MSHPRVTIGIPAFKGRYFREALLCWKRQTFLDFEVIVQDDCSPDGLKNIFDETVGDDSRFSFERNECSTAPNFVDNWMKTLAKAQGEFFVLGSDDDLYEPDYLEKMVALAERYPEIEIFDARHDFIDADGIVVPAPEISEVETQIEWLHAVVCKRRNAIAQSVMCRTAALRAIGGFVNLPAAWGGCDWLTWAKLAKKGVANSAEALMHWRSDGGNTTSAQDLYWIRQKLIAVRMARPMWKALVESFSPQDEVSKSFLAEIRGQVVIRFFSWMELGLVESLPMREYVSSVWTAMRAGDLSVVKGLGRILQAAVG